MEKNVVVVVVYTHNQLYELQELNKYARAEHKGEAEISVIQQIIQLGIGTNNYLILYTN